jgi:cytochrome c oxidase assembly protein subunit 15
MVFFLFLQAGLGAWAVMQPQSAAALALHFGVSLLAFASVLLTTVVLFELDGAALVRNSPVPHRFRTALWAVTGYSYVVVYLGAYVRHANADDGCKGWPTCNGAIIPQFHDKVAANFVHRCAAGVLVVAILALCVWAWRNRAERPDLYWGSAFALLFVLLQAFAGALVAWTDMDLFSALAHAALVALMFGSLSYLCLHVTRTALPQVEDSTPLSVPHPLREPAAQH